MKRFNEKFGKNFKKITLEAERFLLSHTWEGNVREIKNTIERIVLMEDADTIDMDHLAFLKTLVPLKSESHKKVHLVSEGINLNDMNKELIFSALELAGGNKTEAAKLLGISRPTLVYRIKKYRCESS